MRRVLPIIGWDSCLSRFTSRVLIHHFEDHNKTKILSDRNCSNTAPELSSSLFTNIILIRENLVIIYVRSNSPDFLKT
jgi:hypothetical protein